MPVMPAGEPDGSGAAASRRESFAVAAGEVAASGTRHDCGRRSEPLAPGPDVDLQGPGGAVLAVERVVGFRDRIRIEHAAFGKVRDQIREPLVDGGHVDDAVDDHVADVNAARSQ